MDCIFSEKELLLRAVLPPDRRPDFWKDGRLSSAALKDKHGLSVERTYDRSLEDSINYMLLHLHGFVASVGVSDCKDVSAYIVYMPSSTNKYHSEIHGSSTDIVLSDIQAKKLAKRSVKRYDPNLKIMYTNQ